MRQSTNLVKNAELLKAQAKHKLAEIMQVGEPVLTENYVPRVPTVTKKDELAPTKRFFERGLLRLDPKDTLEEVISLEEMR